MPSKTKYVNKPSDDITILNNGDDVISIVFPMFWSGFSLNA